MQFVSNVYYKGVKVYPSLCFLGHCSFNNPTCSAGLKQRWVRQWPRVPCFFWSQVQVYQMKNFSRLWITVLIPRFLPCKIMEKFSWFEKFFLLPTLFSFLYVCMCVHVILITWYAVVHFYSRFCPCDWTWNICI